MNVLTNFSFFRSPDVAYSLILFLTFLAVALLVIGLAFLVINRDRIAERLSKLLSQDKPADDSAKPKLVEETPQGFTAKISKPLTRISTTAPYEKGHSTRIRLMQAGLRSKQALFNFLALKVLGTLLLPAAFLASSFLFKLTPERLVLMVVLALVGFFLPDIVLFLMIQKRKQNLTRALPDAIDLMVVCVEAGLGLDMTFKRVGEEIRALSKELSDEFLLTNLEVRSGQARQESFKNMVLRTGVQEVGHLMTMLAQTSRFGTSLATALRVHSNAMRVKRRQTAEELAAKAAIKLLFPLVFFIFPALFVVLLGPGVIRILKVLLPTMQGG